MAEEVPVPQYDRTPLPLYLELLAQQPPEIVSSYFNSDVNSTKFLNFDTSIFNRNISYRKNTRVSVH
jgi:hypothetical protein